jgi:hypothetical protein
LAIALSGAIALPATPATVAAYLAALADLGLKVSTISRRATVIAYAHKLAGFEPPNNESVKAGHARSAAQARDRAEGQSARHGGGRGEARQAHSR